MASAVGMIAYKGRSKLEDYALNFAGVNAFFVALVSNSFQGLLDAARATEGAPTAVADGAVVASSSELLQNLRISVATFLVLLAVFVIADSLLMHWTKFRWSQQTRATNVLIVISWVGELVLLVVVAFMLVGLETIGGRSIFLRDLLHGRVAPDRQPVVRGRKPRVPRQVAPRPHRRTGREPPGAADLHRHHRGDVAGARRRHPTRTGGDALLRPPGRSVGDPLHRLLAGSHPN